MMKNGGDMTHKIANYLLAALLLAGTLFIFTPGVQANASIDKMINDISEYFKRGEYEKGLALTGEIPSLKQLTEKQKTALFDELKKVFINRSRKRDLALSIAIAQEWSRLFSAEKLPSLYYATLLYETGNHEKASVFFTDGFKAKEQYEKVSGDLLKAFYNNAANLYLDVASWDTAAEYISLLYKQDTKYPTINLLKCRLLFNMKKYDEGLQTCEAAFDKSKKYASVVDYLTYAGYYRINKNYNKSLEITREALNRFPTSDGIAATAASDSARLKNYYEALILVFREDMIVSETLKSSGNYSKLMNEIISLVKTSDVDKNSKSIKFFNAFDLLENKKADDALKILESIDENRVLFRGIIELFRAEAYELKEDFKEADKIYTRLIERDPSLIMTYCKLFELHYNKTGEKEKALSYYKRARSMKPNHWKVKQIERFLAEK